MKYAEYAELFGMKKVSPSDSCGIRHEMIRHGFFWSGWEEGTREGEAMEWGFEGPGTEGGMGGGMKVGGGMRGRLEV